MEKTVETLGRIALPESLLFLVKAGFLFCFSGVILYLILAATYPPVHDAVHDFRHSLAIVPCH